MVKLKCRINDRRYFFIYICEKKASGQVNISRVRDVPLYRLCRYAEIREEVGVASEVDHNLINLVYLLQ